MKKKSLIPILYSTIILLAASLPLQSFVSFNKTNYLPNKVTLRVAPLKKSLNYSLTRLGSILGIGSTTTLQNDQPITDAPTQTEISCSSACPYEHPFAKAGIIGVQEQGAVVATDLAASVYAAPLKDNGVVSLPRSRSFEIQEEEISSLLDQDDNAWIQVEPSYEPMKWQQYQVKKLVVGQKYAQNGTLLFVCVHGTFSNEKAFGGDQSNSTTQSLIQFAKQLCHAHNKAVELISFSWSGFLNKEARFEAGEILAETIIDECNNNMGMEQIWAFAHSHGCNVLSLTANKLRGNKTIDVAVLAASPSPDVQYPATQGATLPLAREAVNIKKIYHFYGTGDFTQAMGSLQSNLNFDRKLPACQNVYNIRLQVDGNNLDHIQIKGCVARNLAGLLHTVDSHYAHFYDLDADYQLDGTMPRYPMMAIRDKKVCHPAIHANKSCLEAACSYSANQEQLFTQEYGRSIHEKLPGSTVWTAKLRWCWHLLCLPFGEIKSAQQDT